MTITIEKSIQNYSSLSREAQLVLSLIPEGTDWVNEFTNPEAPNYVFDSEAELLSAVLDGLHQTQLLYVSEVGLLVDPQKLMLIGPDQLQNLVTALGDENDGSALQILSDNELLANSVLKSKSASFLKKCGLSTNLLFQTMGLSDSIALYELSTSGNPVYKVSATIAKQAASYAVAIAQTVSEFCNLYRFYLQILDKLNIDTDSAQQSQEMVDNVYQALVPFARKMLVCPQISGSTGADEVNQAISTWLDYGNQIGFSSMSTSLLQLAQNVSVANLDNQSIAKEVSNYEDTIQSFLRDNPVESPSLSQDGNYLSYPINSSNPVVSFTLDKRGCLALDTFYETSDN